MVNKFSNLLLWHKIAVLLTTAIILLATGIAATTLYSLNQAGREIEFDSKKVLSDQTELFLKKFVRERADNLNANLRNSRTAAFYGALTLQNNQYGRQSSVKKLLSTLYSQTRYCSKTYFISSQGEMERFPILQRQLDTKNQIDLIREPYFPEPGEFHNRNGKAVWSKVYADPLADHFELVIDAVAPVFAADKIRGYLGVTISLTKMITQMNQHAPILGSYSFLLDTDFQLIAAPPTARVELASSELYRPRGIIDLSVSDNPELDMESKNGTKFIIKFKIEA